MEMPNDVYSKIETLCGKGSVEFDDGHFEKALELFCEALDLVPEPVQDWEAATWIFASIGDALFSLGRFEKSLDAFLNATKCLGGVENPFNHLRLGQNYFELEQFSRATDELARAYMLDGMDIFEGEDEKYISCLRSVMKLG